MWRVKGQDLSMAEGDYGIALSLGVSGVAFTDNDLVKLTIKQTINSTTLVEKTFSEATTRYESGKPKSTVQISLTAAESALLPVGSYVYCLDWYQDGAFLCNIIPASVLKVVDKA